MSMSRWVTGGALGLMTGMGAAAWLGDEAPIVAIFCVVGAIIWVSLFPERQTILWAGVVGLSLWIGLLWYARAFDGWQALPEVVEFSGPVEIISRGEPKVFYRPVTVRPSAEEWSLGDILYRAPIDFSHTPGQTLNFYCPLERPQNFEPGFDYRHLLASRGTGYVCERGGQFELSQRDSGRFRSGLYVIQSGFRAKVNALLPEPMAGLLTGLLIGGSDTLAPEMKAVFAETGLSHIVAVSGYNMSVVAEGLVILSLILGMWRKWAVGLAIIGLFCFLLVIDGSAASLRAALMAWLAFGAYFVGRPAASWNGLLIAAIIMLAVNPLLIRYDVGFQLSFLATLALLFFMRSFETFDFFRHWYGKVAAWFLTTIIIELFTAPIIISTFGMISLIAPVANAIILPLVPWAMFAGIAAVALAMLVPFLAFLLTPVVWLPVVGMIVMAEGMAAIPGASLTGLDSTPLFAVGWYVGLGVGVYLIERWRKRYVLGMAH